MEGMKTLTHQPHNIIIKSVDNLTFQPKGIFMKPIISFDFDMTLFDHQSLSIPASTMAAIGKLRGTRTIVIATGRDMDAHYSARYRDIIVPDAIVHMNGTKITINDEVIFKQTFNKMLLKALLDYAEEKGLCIGTTEDEKDYFTSPEEVTRHDINFWGDSKRNFQNIRHLLDMEVYHLSYIGNEKGAKDIEAHFPWVKLPMYSHKTGADVVEKNISKAVGLQHLCNYLNTDMSETVSFGDSMNDYEMIQETGIGVAMGNAIDELKEIADYVTDSIDCDGIWNACRHLNLI